MNKPFPSIRYQVDICAVGDAMASLTVANATARHGVKVVLMNRFDRILRNKRRAA